MPGVPATLSALLGIVSEGFEDAHYFFDLDGEGHGHEHSDLPNQVLQLLFSPLFALAASWHYWFQAPGSGKSWGGSYQQMLGQHLHEEGCSQQAENVLSSAWYGEEVLMRVQKLEVGTHTWLDKVGCELIKSHLTEQQASDPRLFSNNKKLHSIAELSQKAFQAR